MACAITSRSQNFYKLFRKPTSSDNLLQHLMHINQERIDKLVFLLDHSSLHILCRIYGKRNKSENYLISMRYKVLEVLRFFVLSFLMHAIADNSNFEIMFRNNF